jgi:hypothetical protein
MKLITPPGMLFAVALLALYGVYSAWFAVAGNSLAYALVAAIAFAACFGTAILHPWSRYLVHFLTAGFIGAWLHSIYTALRAGYFEFAFSSRLDAVRSLVPGLVLVVMSCACSLLVSRHFKRGDHRT